LHGGIGAAPKILIYIPFWFLRLDGKHKTVTVMMTIMGVGNVLLDLLFLFGMDMGVFGAALASVIHLLHGMILSIRSSSSFFGVAASRSLPLISDIVICLFMPLLYHVFASLYTVRCFLRE